MKTVSAPRTRTDMEAILDAAQKERVVVTRNGKPSAVVMGIENYDEEDLYWAGSEQFWRSIEASRQSPSIPLSELKARLGIRGASTRSKGEKATARRTAKPRTLRPKNKR